MSLQVLIASLAGVATIISAFFAWKKFSSDRSSPKLYYNVKKHSHYHNPIDFADVYIWSNSFKVARFSLEVNSKSEISEFSVRVPEGVSVTKKDALRVEFSINPNASGVINLSGFKNDITFGGFGSEEIHESYPKHIFYGQAKNIRNAAFKEALGWVFFIVFGLSLYIAAAIWPSAKP
ncbi:hypothetical protein [Rhabdaerophilum sp. SD176]|uniref:hypothetical protein n=1 Tax=Rhabdaerophilum sp. SD176 TaxID=2983548 RepID=UPI0024DF6126|nr:hypothetical protein [Rhabdaerophilum sp. SD176]